nr:leucine zipper, homeobox-associated, homeodomain-like protein [Tanacetum cinerariifolium]
MFPLTSDSSAKAFRERTVFSNRSNKHKSLPLEVRLDSRRYSTFSLSYVFVIMHGNQFDNTYAGVELLMLSRSMSYNEREGCEEINVRGDAETSNNKRSQLGEKKRRLNLEN